MSSRIRRPETVKLPITRGDWLLVKKYLTAGETRARFATMLKDGATGGDRVDSTKVGLSTITAYLLDWSITDADDKPVTIVGQPQQVLEDALNSLETESFTEILHAIEAHEAAMEQAWEAEKNAVGGNGSSPISPSAA